METVLRKLKDDSGVKVVSGEYDLPSGLKLRVDDFRAAAIIDDKYYEKWKSLYLRRGVAAVYTASETGGLPVYLLAGCPKFGYYDDVFTQPPDLSQLKFLRRVYTVKENGEAGHLAFFPTKRGKWYAIVGSKNVHIVVSVEKESLLVGDIEYYASLKSTRLTAAVSNAQLLLKVHKDLLLNRQEMRQFLYDKQMTITFEACFNNHIVAYDEHAAIAFALTLPQFNTVEEQGLCAVPDKIAFEALKPWGFKIPSNDVESDAERFEKLDRKYETLDNCEGAVVYEVYLNESTGQEIVGKMYKHKNHAYIIRRMARELIKRKASFTSWKSRFLKIHIDPTGLEHEIDQLLAFYVWLAKTKRREINEQTGWANYVQENFKDLLDTFRNSGQDVAALVKEAETTIGATAATNNEFAICLVGLQGSGKTLLRNGLFEILGKDRVTYVNQDELGGERRAFIRELRNHRNYAGKIMVVEKCNHTYRLREDVYETFGRVLIAEFVHPENDMEAFCEQRIKSRGANHLNLPFTRNVRAVIEKTSEFYAAVSETEKIANSYLALDVTDLPERNLKQVIDYLQQNNLLDPKLEFVENDLGPKLRAIQQSYEARIREQVIKYANYWIANADVNTLREIVKPWVTNGIPAGTRQNLTFKWEQPEKEKYHITLAYKNKLSKKDAEDCMANPEITVKATGIAYNAKCAAIKIAKEGQLRQICEKTTPHITIGWANGIKPEYANTMLDTGDHSLIPCDFTLNLIINYSRI